MKGLSKITRRLIAADLFSDIGNQFVALYLVDLLVFRSSDAISSLVMLCLIHQLPSVLFSPLAGSGVDRLGPGRWMMLSNLIRCLLAGTFALITARWAIFGVYLIFVTVSLFFSIGRLSAVPLLIPGDRIFRFNAVSERVAIGGAILSPWLIGVILAGTGRTAPPVMAALIFAGTVLVLAALPDPEKTNTAADDQKKIPRTTGSCPAGATGSRPDRGLTVCFFMLGFVVLGGGVLNLGLPLLFKTSLAGDIGRWGLMMSAFQAGAFVSTLTLPRCAALMRGKAMPAAWFLILAAAMFALPFVTGSAGLAGLMALFGFGFTLMQLFWESRIQQGSPPAAVGKTMSLMSAYKGACFLAAVLSGAAIARFWGAEPFLMIGALVLGSASFFVRRT